MSATFGILFESDKEMEPAERTFLRTLGHPVLRRGDGSVVEGLRRKDLALLAYLCVEGDRPFSRAHLAALLWGESPEEKARHSLTQALRRAAAAVGRRALIMERDTVRWTGAAACDAQLLLEGDERLDELLTIYEGPFLEAFEAGFGSQEFSAWADARRAELRRAAVRWLDRAGAGAERERDWERALRLGERLVQIDREWEGGHRRVMRALLERGERNLALRHFREFARWLTYEIGGHPDPETMALADLIRAAASFATHAPPAQPSHEPTTALSPSSPSPAAEEGAEAPATPGAGAEADARRALHGGVAPAARDAEEERADGEREPSVPMDDAREEESAPGDEASPPAGRSAAAASEERGAPVPPRAETLVAPFVGDDPEGDALAARPLRRVFAAAAVMALAMLTAGPRSANVHVPLESGVVIQARGQVRAYLVYGRMLWAFPDTLTLTRCLGGSHRVRHVRTLPPWPRRTLPSVQTHPWLCATLPAAEFAPLQSVRHDSRGCTVPVLPGHVIPQPILDTIQSAYRRAPGMPFHAVHPTRHAASAVVRGPESPFHRALPLDPMAGSRRPCTVHGPGGGLLLPHPASAPCGISAPVPLAGR